MTTSLDPRMYTALPLVGVGVVILRDDRVLLIQRGKPPRQGQWSLPGGMQHLGETVHEAVAREAMEETGLSIEINGLLDVIDLIETDSAGKTSRHYTLIDFWGVAPEGEPRAGDDAMNARWFTRAELDALPIWEKTREIIALAFLARGWYERRMTQRHRKLLGMLLLVGGIAAYGLIMADLLSRLPRLNIVVESLIYAAAGIAWIFLARPVLVWMETGSWWVRRDR